MDVTCEGCGASFVVADAHAGKTGKCRKCGAAVTIPTLTASSPDQASISPQVVAEEPNPHEAFTEANITTTDSIHGWTITDYRGLVSAHVVAGTGFFSDFAASLTDVFGGRSLSYQRQLASIEQETLDSLRNSAMQRGANWILGVRVDFDEISGKGMQMFMVSAQGTAVQAIRTPASADVATPGIAAGSFVREQLRKDAVLQLIPKCLAEERAITEDVMQAICDTRLAAGVPLAIKVIFADPQVALSDRVRQLALQSLRLLPRDAVRDAIHEKMLEPSSEKAALDLYRELSLLDLAWTRDILISPDRHSRRIGLQALCKGVALTYTPKDIPILRSIAETIPVAFPDRSTLVEVRGFLSSQSSERWRCENGHDNTLEARRCETCNIDRFGHRIGTFSPDEALRVTQCTLRTLEAAFGMIP